MGRPVKVYRTIRGPGTGYRVTHYSTEMRRNLAADRDARRDGEDVLCEVWDESHPQDEINQGWALDRVAKAPDPDPTLATSSSVESGLCTTHTHHDTEGERHVCALLRGGDDA